MRWKGSSIWAVLSVMMVMCAKKMDSNRRSWNSIFEYEECVSELWDITEN